MSTYQHDDVVPFRNSSLGKKEQVAQMFDRISGTYDLLNRFLSGGIDRRWRKKAIGELTALKPREVLDVATGTGDMPLAIWRQLKPERIVGIDISEGMLAYGRAKIAKAKLNGFITLEAGDSEAINFPPASFDAVTVAFGVRNFQHLEAGLQEMKRVLRPGGKLVILEFSKPRNRVFLAFYGVYLRRIAPGVGKLFSKDRDAYQYLNDSVQAFPEGEEFIGILDRTGFSDSYRKTLSFGICTIYCAQKK